MDTTNPIQGFTVHGWRKRRRAGFGAQLSMTVEP